MLNSRAMSSISRVHAYSIIDISSMYYPWRARTAWVSRNSSEGTCLCVSRSRELNLLDAG